jgi:hypothetical protein
MAFQQIPGGGLWVPADLFSTSVPPGVANASVISFAGDFFAWMGPVWFKERTGTKNIQTVGFHFGGIVKSGGSGLTVSLQDVSLTAGPPMQPDGVKDQTFAIANNNASFAANAWIQTGNLSATRTVAYGELLSVVIEFDGAGRLGSDTFVIVGVSEGGAARLQSQGVTKIGATFTAFSAVQNIVLGFDDGTFGTLQGGYPATALGNHLFTSATGVANEYAMGIRFPFPVKISGAAIYMQQVAGGDCTINLYQGTTVLQSVTIDANAISMAASPRLMYVSFPETALAANTLYFLSVAPLTTNSVTTYYADVAAAAHLQAHGGGMAFCEYTRLNGGAWSAPVTTRAPYMSLELSAFDDGSSGGAGSGGAALSRIRTGY